MKAFKSLLCSLLLIACMTVPVFANDDAETFSIAIDYTNPNGYSQIFTDDDGNIIQVDISPVEEVVARGTSTEELGYGTYTRSASVSFTERTCNETMTLSFKFKATISGTENPRLHSISNVFRTNNIYAHSGPIVNRQYASSSAAANITASGTGKFSNEVIKHLSIVVTLTYNEILQISTSTS